MKNIQPALFIPVLICLSGAAALSWEGIWQIKSTLALGVSAHGTALTLAVTMGGMGLGSLLMGYFLKGKDPKHPLRLYGFLECVIGVCGLLLAILFQTVEKLDTHVYSIAPDMAPAVHIAGVIAAISIPALCMGATFPVIGLAARKYKKSLAVFYGLNTMGAAAGILFATVVLIPALGITHTGFVIAGMNFLVGLATLIPVAEDKTAGQPPVKRSFCPSEIIYIINQLCRLSAWLFDRGRAAVVAPEFSNAKRIMIACTTGFAVFALEIAWFRSLTATFQSTTYAFAIMLASVLLALSQAAGLVSFFKEKKISLGVIMALAGTLVLLATPLIENMDIWVSSGKDFTAVQDMRSEINVMPDYSQANTRSSLVMIVLFCMSYLTVGIPMIFLGVAFPWIVEDRATTHEWGGLYAMNTLSAIVGAIGAAWVMLPWIGFVYTALVVGIVVVIVGLLVMPDRRRRIAWGLAGFCALMVAITHNSGAGKTRALVAQTYGDPEGIKLLESHEGPSSTISVVEYKSGHRRLLIDGASASGQAGNNGIVITHYLNWMGSLPMLAHAGPENALVICFGTGQTANAVRKEGLTSLDIVDLEKTVFNMGHHFASNESVLTDPKVNAIVMDGRAYMRRVQKKYDVITLEPMPPTMPGVNALYSREFYQHAYERLNDGGVIAQWLPFNSLTPYYATSMVRTFMEIFPNALLWIDPVDSEGIILGMKGDHDQIGTEWPGFMRTSLERNLSEREVRDAVTLNKDKLAQYAAKGGIITDDNQLLAYGQNARGVYMNIKYLPANMLYLKQSGLLTE